MTGADFEILFNFISNVSFPIAACVMIWISSRKQYERYREDVEKLRTTVESNTEAMNAQKEILVVIKDRLI